MKYLLVSVLLASVNGDVCPSGYAKGPGDLDCYKGKSFYNAWATQWMPKSYDDMVVECNADGGGMLASVHSAEENLHVQTQGGEELTIALNIGLRCHGRTCKWDDGTPLTFTAFPGTGPADDGQTRCYGFDGHYPFNTWAAKSCGKQEKDTWICKVKAKTIDCNKGETAYRGGCISIHTTPLDQKSAETSCPGGGHLMSIHSVTENNIIKNAALNAGAKGTIYIGGQYTNGQFEWIDSSYYLPVNWANGFPNTVFGSCVQMLLASEFGVAGQWTNIDCSTEQPYICFRDGSNYGPVSPVPKASPVCPQLQYYTGTGTIISPNFPLSIPPQQTCEYVIGAKEGTKASVKFTSYDCKSGTTLSLFDGLNSVKPYLIFNTTSPSIDQYYSSKSSVMKIVFSAVESSPPIGTGWEAEFTGL